MKKFAQIVCAILLLAVASVAQDRKPSDSAYKFTITISELDGGKRTNERVYSMILRERQTGKIDTGNRVPIVTSVKTDQPPSYVYMDVGLDLTGNYTENNGNVD